MEPMQKCQYCGFENDGSAFYCSRCVQDLPRLAAQQEWEREMEIRPRPKYVALLVYYFRCLWWHRRAVLAGLACGLALGLAVAYLAPRVYGATARLKVEYDHSDTQDF
jgi:hypothetical protein